MAKKPETHRTIARNKRALHEYEVLEELECGIVLRGTEVKTLRGGKGSIAEAYGRFRGGELWLVGANFPEYAFGTAFNHAPTRERKLLAHRRELDKWLKRVKEKGVTVVPLELYFHESRIKLRLGLCKGKRMYDKRQTERERTDRREMDRAMGRRR
jgi:SsrA-binding protein